ncbi:HPr family phosphocarrier protein [Endozoicomonas sp. ISHI1]|uniref:HPr family phosphocarrier protein n=1 Tax=Endozoicomonas sp. ISHI1 TaxID=2825882 RepID=UPI0035A0B44C
MLTLNLSNIFLNQSAESKLQVIELIGQKMVELGYTTEAYTAGLKAREAISSTFLGNGISIPHGTPDTRDAVIKTGVVIFQFPQGVEWGEDEQVYIAVGIAACSNEHLQILKGLTRILGNDELCSFLAKTDSPQDVIGAINSPPRERRPFSEERVRNCIDANPSSALQAVAARGNGCAAPAKEVLSRAFTILNPNGIHTRPAKVFVSTIKRFDSRIEVSNPDKSDAFINGKSLMKLLSLGITRGSTIEVKACGPDAHEAMDALEQVINQELAE